VTLLHTDGGQLQVSDLGCPPEPLGLGHVCEPRLAVLEDGTVLLAYRSGSARLSADGRVGLLRSQDGGASWEWSGAPFPSKWDGRPGDQLLATLTGTHDGRVVAWLGWMDRGDDRPWRNRETEGRLPIRILQAESSDGGASWGAPREVTLPGVEQAVPQYLITLADGTLLAGYETFKHYDDPAPWRYRAGVARSGDGGRTWSSTTAAEVDASGRMWWDPRAAELADGRLVQCYHAFDYPAGRDADLHLGWSDDGGRTWSAPVPTGVPGQVTWPVILGTSTVVYLQQRRHSPAGIVALVAGGGDEAAGKAADEAVAADNSISLYSHDAYTLGAADGSRSAVEYFDDMDGFTFGHPTGVRLPDGAVLEVHYAGDRNGTRLHANRLTELTRGGSQ
jgi:hypothetical protein